MQEKKMPSKGGYLALVIFGFLIGVLWGALSISPYLKMKEAVDNGDAETAQANAKKIRIFVIVGLVLNVIFALVQIAQLV